MNPTELEGPKNCKPHASATMARCESPCMWDTLLPGALKGRIEPGKVFVFIGNL